MAAGISKAVDKLWYIISLAKNKSGQPSASMRPWLTCRVSQGKRFKGEFKTLHFERLANALKFNSIPKQLCFCTLPESLETGY